MQRTILIVDDSKINRQLLCKILGSEYTVLEAENGRQALTVLRNAYESISAVLLDLLMPEMDGYEVLRQMRCCEELVQIPVIVTTSDTDTGSEVKALSLGANDFVTKPYNPDVIRHRLWNTINLRETAALINSIQRDKLTGLYNRETFFEKAGEMIAEHEPGHYVMSCFDINNFKVINDQYGSTAGDSVLKSVAEIIRDGFHAVGGICCRIASDDFAVLYPRYFMDSPEIERLHHEITVLNGSNIPISFSIGRYIVDDPTLPVSAMYDRAVIAELSVKRHFDVHVAQYDESMRERILREQEIINDMKSALTQGQFEVWLQPQYNHSSGALIGAEALVRWRHPKYDLVPPGDFIPIFERNGFIFELDKYVWEQTCLLIRKWIDAGHSPLPVSVNLSRYDVLRVELIASLTGFVEKYRIPVDLLRLEITESAFAESTDRIISVVKQLIDYGFIVEIDDFGSGYSSLNTLKDVPAHVLKLDMRFLEGHDNSSRGGNILESIVRMTKWLDMAVIAEGVETIEQADYLRSIGCNYLQGYLYARPMPAEDYEKLAANCDREEKMLTLETLDTLDNDAFWSPTSIDTLIFNSYVGGACVFEYYKNEIEILRVNEKYAKTLGGEDMSIEDALNIDLEDYLSAESLANMHSVLHRAIDSGKEITVEIPLVGLRSEGHVAYFRSSMRVIASTGMRYLFYCMIEDITAQRETEQKERKAAAQLQAIMQNVHGGMAAVTMTDGKISYLFVNDTYFTMFGYTREQFESDLPRGLVDLIHPDDLQNVYTTTAQAETDGATDMEFRAYTRSGGMIWVRSHSSTCRIEGIATPVHIAVINDITREKEAERHIRSLNEALSELMRDTPGGFARIRVFADGSLSTVYVNDGYCQLLGMSFEEILARTREDAAYGIHPEDRQLVADTVREMLLTGETCSIKYRLQHADGSYIYLMVFGRVTRNEADETFINAYYADLSAQEKEALAFRDMLPIALSAMMKFSPNLLFVKDRNLRYVCCSQAFSQMLGLSSADEIIGKTDYDLVDRDLAEEYRAVDREIMESRKPILDYIERLPSANGDVRYADTSKYLLYDSSGNIIGIYGVARDITKEREAFAQLKLLTDSLPGGIATYACSPEGIQLIYFNDGLYAPLGYTREAYQHLADEDPLALVHPEDLPMVMQAYHALIKENIPLNCTCRVRRKDGASRWVNLRGAISEWRGDTAIVNAVFYHAAEPEKA